MGEPQAPQQRLTEGTRVSVTFPEATVAEEKYQSDDAVLAVRLGGTENSVWYVPSEATVTLLPPDVVPGCIMTAGGATWCVRRSNSRDSLRIMPVDLSKKLRTLPIEDFTARYPKARVVFDPRQSGREV